MKAYRIYHQYYSEVIAEILTHTEKLGFKLDSESVWNQITTGAGKPGVGETQKLHLEIIGSKKQVHAQVYGMGEKYELNMYVN